MSTVSKILVILILVLVAGSCFLQIAVFAQRANYRKLFEDEKARGKKGVAELEAEITKKNKEISDINQQMIGFKENADTLTQKVGELTNDLSEEKAKVLKAENLAKEKENDLATMSEKVTSMMAELQALNEKMRRDSQDLLTVKREYERVVNSITALRDKNNSLMMSLTNTRSELEVARSENQKLTFTLRKYAATAKETIEVVKPKVVVRAHVLASNNEAGVVLLSVGKQDKVELGMEFIIHRGQDYLCKVRVESLYPDTCVARVISETVAGDTVAVNVGDNAFTD